MIKQYNASRQKFYQRVRDVQKSTRKGFISGKSDVDKEGLVTLKFMA